MKKLISLTLALMLVFSLATVAMAVDSEPDYDEVLGSDDYEDMIDIQPKINKTYTINGNTAEAPEEDFTLKFEGISYVNGAGVEDETAAIPTISDVTFAYDTDFTNSVASKTLDIDPDDYDIGVYTYKITEENNGTAGVTYTSDELYLVLTILYNETEAKHFVAAMHVASANGDKVNSITNTYNAGSLLVSKEISGNTADMTAEFEFVVTFTAPVGRTFNLKADGGVQIVTTDTPETGFTNNSVTYKFNLGNGDSLRFTNIPVGTEYTVTETKANADNYETTFTGTINTNGGKATITDTSEATVEVENARSSDVDTGITLDSLPFVLILAVCAGAVVLFVIKRRNSAEF